MKDCDVVFGLVAVAVCIGLAVIVYIVFWSIDETPPEANMWVVIIDAYPGGNVECHAAVADQILRMTDILHSSPYAKTNDGPSRQSVEKARDLATEIVLGSDHVPEACK